MVYLGYEGREKAAAAHYAAVFDFVSRKPSAIVDALYADIRPLLPALPEKRSADDYSWLRSFILADLDTLYSWTRSRKCHLKFTFFRSLYTERFAKSASVFVDAAKTYNAFTYLRLIGVNVCPYCDRESIQLFENISGEKRSGEIDHFFPKEDRRFPALAMCFYNLVPSCHTCNHAKLTADVEAHPYDPGIEDWSRFHSIVPLGANFNSLDEKDFKVNLICKNGMKINNNVMGLESRYNATPKQIRDILFAIRDFSDENCAQMLAMGIDADFIRRQKESLLGLPYPQDRGLSPLAKLRHDLQSQ